MGVTMHWHVHELHSRIDGPALRGDVAVVIDVLRASTTMVTALAHGAAGVLPVAGVDEARRRAAAIGPAAVLGGERGGVRIEGFELGNSPAEYTAGRVAGRTVVITTTNGTAAIATCAAARDVLVGAIVNRSAVAAAARRLAAEAGGAVHLVCAGTDGVVTAEDVLAAGAILDAAARHPESADDACDPAALAAREAFRRLVPPGAADPAAGLERAFAVAPGGVNLLALGMAADLATCARIDVVAVVPRLDRASGMLVPA